MRYRVHGLDTTTGAPVELLIDAQSELDASADALVRRVSPLRIEPADDGAAGPLTPQSPQPVLVRLEPDAVQTIQLTAKRWKGTFAIGAILMTAGLSSCAWAIWRDPRALTDPTLLAGLGAVLAGLGFLAVLIGRLGAWWHHG